MMSRVFLRRTIPALLAATALSPVATAQEDGRARPDEIIVTATKRAERITDVPIAITAIGGDEIQARGAFTIQDLQFSIPGLNINEASPGGAKVSLRGIDPGDGTGLPVVGVYVDEVGVSVDQQQRNGIFPLIDVERVEVLRGPQGTLYGQGSVAGTIRYISKDPDLEEVDGYVEGNVYHQGKGDVGYRGNGAVSVPIVENVLGIRLTAGYDMLSGWVDYPNVAPGGVSDANETERFFIRPKILLQPTENLTVSVLYQYFDQTSDTTNISNVSDITFNNDFLLSPSNDESHLINGIIEYDFGPVTLVSSSGYQDRDFDFAFFDGAFTSMNSFKQFTQEIRLSSNGEGPFQYTVGGWYRDFEDLSGFFALVPAESQSWAVFGEGTYDFTDRFALTVGGRYYEDDRETGGPTPDSDTFTSFSPRVSAAFGWTDDVSSYATVSKGFRSGGFNGIGTNFGPETLWNYEAGTKASFFDGDLFVDVVVYYADYQARQSQTAVEILPGVFQAVTTTSGEASGFGIEAAMSALLPYGFRLDGTIAYNDITNDIDTVELAEGQRFNNVPKVTASVSLSQLIPINDIYDATWRIDYQYSSSYDQVARINFPGAPFMVPAPVFQDFSSDPQHYVNIRAGIERGRMGLYFDATNLFDEDAALFSTFPIAVTQEAVRARPRSFGLTVRFNFQDD